MHRILSIIDVNKVEEVKNMVLKGDMISFYKVLHAVGFDVSRDIDFQVCWHRPMTSNEIVNAGRWIGTERTDNEWMNSGYSSYENRLERIGTKDIHLLREIVNMSRLPNYTSMIIEHMQGESSSSRIKYVKEEEVDQE